MFLKICYVFNHDSTLNSKKKFLLENNKYSNFNFFSLLSKIFNSRSLNLKYTDHSISSSLNSDMVTARPPSIFMRLRRIYI